MTVTASCPNFVPAQPLLRLPPPTNSLLCHANALQTVHDLEHSSNILQSVQKISLSFERKQMSLGHSKSLTNVPCHTYTLRTDVIMVLSLKMLYPRLGINRLFRGRSLFLVQPSIKKYSKHLTELISMVVNNCLIKITSKSCTLQQHGYSQGYILSS